MKVSVIIKSLNEEKNITRVIESALQAVEKVGGGEVIIADSLSLDRTIELASTYPVRIVQLVEEADRCCGIGAEIGYRIASGEYLYLIDADMVLDGDFLVAATKLLDNDETIVGVGGLVEEINIVNAEFRGRVGFGADHLQPGEVDRLNGGGLFRKSAIDQLGYLTNRNLHAFEEIELASRLRAHGWRLLRLGITAVKHYGHTDASFLLLYKRWKSRYAWGGGELLRETWRTSYFGSVLRSVRIYRVVAVVLLWWFCIMLTLCLATYYSSDWWLAALGTLFAPFVAAAVRRRSLADGVYAVASLSVYTASIFVGFFASRRGEPTGTIAVRILQ